jgi:hypothetical protein
MTAYLQPGDKIHIQFPYQGGASADKEKADELSKEYRDMGVEIFAYSSCPSSLPAHVVAVIRSSKAVPVPPWQEDPLLDEVNLDPNR